MIAEAGLKGQADIAKQALDLFASIYGAEAGNLALKAMTLNGVYLGRVLDTVTYSYIRVIY